MPIRENVYASLEVDIDFTKLDCSKLDEEKSDNDVKVKGLDVTKFLGGSDNYLTEDDNLWENIKLLLGKQSNLVSVSTPN